MMMIRLLGAIIVTSDDELSHTERPDRNHI